MAHVLFVCVDVPPLKTQPWFSPFPAFPSPALPPVAAMAALACQLVPLMKLNPRPTRALLDGLTQDLLGRFWARRHQRHIPQSSPVISSTLSLSVSHSTSPTKPPTIVPRPASPAPQSIPPAGHVSSHPVSQVPDPLAKPTPAPCPVSPVKVSQVSSCAVPSTLDLLKKKVCFLLKGGKEVVKYAVSGPADFNELPCFKELATQTEPILSKTNHMSNSTQTPKGLGNLVASIQAKGYRTWATQTTPVLCYEVDYTHTYRVK